VQFLLNTAYFPSLAWFACIAQGECTVDLAGNFQKQSFRNRTNILSSQGVLGLTVPVVHAGKVTISAVEISYRENWQRQHIRSIETAYRNSPFFEYYWPELLPILTQKQSLLAQLNELIINKLCQMCSLNSPSATTSWSDVPVNMSDMRERIHPKRSTHFQIEPYVQVFDITTTTDRLSLLDLLFAKGPDCRAFLSNCIQIV